jgi:hypothetical protein
LSEFNIDYFCLAKPAQNTQREEITTSMENRDLHKGLKVEIGTTIEPYQQMGMKNDLECGGDIEHESQGTTQSCHKFSQLTKWEPHRSSIQTDQECKKNIYCKLE